MEVLRDKTVYDCRRKQVEDELFLLGKGEAVVVAQLVFKVCEGTVDRVGGVGHLEHGKTQVDEESGQIALEAQKGAAKARMRVAGATDAGHA